MALFCDMLGLLLVLAGIALVARLAAGRLLLPAALPLRITLTGTGGGDGLEQTVKSLLWLRKTGLWRGEVVIEDRGLDHTGALIARTLARQDGVEFDS